MAAKIGNEPSMGVRQVFVFFPTEGATSVSGLDANGANLSYEPFSPPNVYLNGVKLVAGHDYTATTGTSITGIAPMHAGDVVVIEVFGTWSPADAYTKAEVNEQIALMTPPEFVSGLTLSNWVDNPNNGVRVAAGRCAGNGVSASLLTATAKLLSSNWAAGTGAGGLDTGTKAANQTYHVHAIRNNVTGVLDALLSLSATSPTVPSGYTRVQRLGAIMTDGSGNIRPFVQDGNEFRYAVSGGNGVSAYGSTAGNRTYSLLTCPVPTGVRLKLLLSLTLATISTPNPQDGGEAIFGDGANTDVRTHIHRWGIDAGTSSGITFWTMDPVSVRTNTSGQIYFGIQSAHGSYGSQLWVRGWVDESIPRIGT